MQGSFHSYSVEAAIIDHIYITSRVWVASTKRLIVKKPSWTPWKNYPGYMTRFSENTPRWVFPQEREGQFHKIVGMLEAPLENQWLDGRTVLSWTHLWRHCQWCFHSIYTKIHGHLYFLKVGWDHLSIFIQKHSKQILTSFPDHCIPFFWYFISWFKLCA